VDTSFIRPLQRPSPLREELAIPNDAVVALYSGSMGNKQGLEILAAAARALCCQTNLWFVFCGDGPGRSALDSLAAELANVRMLPLQPVERLNDLLNLADIHLLPQKAGAADLVLPSKLTGILASGRPVVAIAESGTQLAEVAFDRGIVVPPGDFSSFVWALEELTNNPSLREKLGRNARAYAVSELEKNEVLSRFERDLLKLVSP